MQLVDIFSQDSITILSRSWPRDSSQELGILPELGCDSSKILRETEILICGRRRKAEGGGGRGGKDVAYDEIRHENDPAKTKPNESHQSITK